MASKNRQVFCNNCIEGAPEGGRTASAEVKKGFKRPMAWQQDSGGLL